MNVFTSTKRFSHSFIMILTLVILSACSSSLFSPKDRAPILFSKLSNNSAFFLAKAKLNSGQENLEWQFVAVQALIAEKQPSLAGSIIEYLQTQALTATQQNALTLLTADNLSIQAKPTQAQDMLNKVDSEQLSETGLIYFLKLQTQLYIDKNEHLEASDNLLLLTPLLTDDIDKQQYNDLLLTQLSLLPIDFLNQYQTTPDEAETITDSESTLSDEEIALTDIAEAKIREEENLPVDVKQQFKEGWYALAALYQRYQFRPNQLIRSLADWKAQYPEHPLLSFMPTQLTNIPELSPYQPENIAVLIPLSGRFKRQGQAIQYGLLDAYYKQLQSKQNRVATDKEMSAPVVKLHFYDTQAQSIEQIVKQFKEQQIDFVIGPLLKNKVEEFLPFSEKMPVLTLNSFPETKVSEMPATETESKQIPWHYAFPLSPEDEAKQAARLIFSEGHKKPLLLAPDSAYGKRIAQAFNQQWLALTRDNSQTETYFFTTKSARLAPFIAKVLQTDNSKRRIEQMKVITGLPLETEQRSRRDIDAIYIISKRDKLLMLKAFLDVSISPFAEKIPLYASSRSNLRDQQNKELANLTFSDTALLLDSDNKTLKRIQQSWANQSFSTLRLFALGSDSYQLIGHLMQLQNNENATYQGLVGQLSLNPDNTVQAQLSWAQYQQGKRIEITSPTAAE